jgi:glucosamine-6-phosphate deaminase
MVVERCADAADVARRAAEMLRTVSSVGIVGLPTGATPIALYEELMRDGPARGATGDAMRFVAVDEFVEPRGAVPGTNRAFFARHLPGIDVRCPDPAAADPAAEIVGFAQEIRERGGLSLCVLGIGTNGHIAFNEPPSAVDAPARVVELTAESRRAHAGAFGSFDAVPRLGMTLGVADILDAARILVLATGEAKADIVARAIEDEPTAEVPASWLQLHPRVVWMLDGAAASRLRRR